MQVRFLLGAALVAASTSTLLAGCGSGSFSSASGLTPAARAAGAAHRAHRSTLLGLGPTGGTRVHHHVKSWLKHVAPTLTLAYLSDAFGNTVNIYDASSTNQSPIGQLGGFNQPQGLWVDVNQNLWVTNTNTQELFAYHRNNTTTFRTLTDTSGYPAGVCGNDNKSQVISVDIQGNGGAAGQTINIYNKGATTPSTQLIDPNAESLYGCAVDAHGNLFVTLQNTAYYPYPDGELDEFVKGSTTPTVIWSNFIYPIGITIDRYNAIDVSDLEPAYPNPPSSTVYLFDPPYTQGPAYSFTANGVAFIQTALNKPQTQLWAANSYGDLSAQAYSYPHGSFLNATSSYGLIYPDGVALSPKSKQ